MKITEMLKRKKKLHQGNWRGSQVIKIRKKKLKVFLKSTSYFILVDLI